jgi:CRP-like cAMP-binding protein
VSEQNFRRLLERSPQVQIKVLEALAERIAATSL